MAVILAVPYIQDSDQMTSSPPFIQANECQALYPVIQRHDVLDFNDCCCISPALTPVSPHPSNHRAINYTSSWAGARLSQVECTEHSPALACYTPFGTTQ